MTGAKKGRSIRSRHDNPLKCYGVGIIFLSCIIRSPLVPLGNIKGGFGRQIVAERPPLACVIHLYSWNGLLLRKRLVFYHNS